MGTLKSFKHIIVKEPDRQLVYQILDKYLDTYEKEGIRILYDLSCMSDIPDNQLELEFEQVKHINHGIPDVRPPVGTSTQGKT